MSPRLRRARFGHGLKDRHRRPRNGRLRFGLCRVALRAFKASGRPSLTPAPTVVVEACGAALRVYLSPPARFSPRLLEVSGNTSYCPSNILLPFTSQSLPELFPFLAGWRVACGGEAGTTPCPSFCLWFFCFLFFCIEKALQGALGGLRVPKRALSTVREGPTGRSRVPKRALSRKTSECPTGRSRFGALDRTQHRWLPAGSQ